MYKIANYETNLILGLTFVVVVCHWYCSKQPIWHTYIIFRRI